MYNRNRYSRYGGNWYQSVFWLLIGILIGQFFRFNITLGDEQQSQTAPVQITQTLEETHNG